MPVPCPVSVKPRLLCPHMSEYRDREFAHPLMQGVTLGVIAASTTTLHLAPCGKYRYLICPRVGREFVRRAAFFKVHQTESSGMRQVSRLELLDIREQSWGPRLRGVSPVSYTHLTLPTIYS